MGPMHCIVCRQSQNMYVVLTHCILNQFPVCVFFVSEIWEDDIWTLPLKNGIWPHRKSFDEFEEFALGGRNYCEWTTATSVIVEFRDGREQSNFIDSSLNTFLRLCWAPHNFPKRAARFDNGPHQSLQNKHTHNCHKMKHTFTFMRVDAYHDMFQLLECLS